MVAKLTAKDFEREVMNADRPVLIDFFAGWCRPCMMLAPVIEAVAQDAEDVRVFKVDIDEEPTLTQRFEVMSVPTLVVMKDGKVTRTASGFRPKQEILDMLSVN